VLLKRCRSSRGKAGPAVSLKVHFRAGEDALFKIIIAYLIKGNQAKLRQGMGGTKGMGDKMTIWHYLLGKYHRFCALRICRMKFQGFNILKS